MVSRISILAFAAAAVAQPYYGGDSNSTWAAAPAQTYACNPAHQYPEGQQCISTNGALTLVSPTTSAASASSSADKNECDAKYNDCRVAPDANMSFCASKYAECLGYNPFTQDATTSATPTVAASGVVGTAAPVKSVAPSASATNCKDSYDSCRTTRVNGLSANQAQCAADNAACEGKCQDQYDTCRTTRVNGLSANQAECAAEYAGCLGRNPFGGPSTATSSADEYVTQVVTAYTTYCPYPTTFAQGNQTYTVTSATTLTITSCPGGCKVTTPVKSLPPATTVTAVVPHYTTECPTPTTVTIESKTYTVTSSTVITVSCKGGCTITTPVSKLPPPETSAPVAPGASAPAGSMAPGASSPAVPVAPGTAAPPVAPPVAPSAGVSTVRAPSSSPASPTGAVYTGAAEKVAGSGALMLGAIGLLVL